MSDRRWTAVDVGGRRKGFHVATIGRDVALRRLVNLGTPAEVVRWLAPDRPFDDRDRQPLRAAEPGERSRYTPEESIIRAGGGCYEWIRNGSELYSALAGDARTSRVALVEVFPTAA